MAGTRGPVPKRSDMRRRRNKGDEVTKIEIPETPGESAAVEAPELGFTTHRIAEEWYAALADSGQARYYEASDWQAARVVAHELGRMLNGSRPSSQMFAAVMSAMGDLLVTEGSRRRVRLEIERAPAQVEDPAVAIMAEYRKAAGK